VITILPVTGVAEIRPGDDLGRSLEVALRDLGDADERYRLRENDVVVVTQKVVSKAEGRLVAIDPDDPDAHRALARSEAVRILRRRGDLIISETREGWVCAHSGVDVSNVARGYPALLPEDSDRSARRLHHHLSLAFGVHVGVVVSDTFGRPWRRGLTDVAIGVAGIPALHDLRGSTDAEGRELQVTEIAVADELAAAAELAMGKAAGIPAAVVRGFVPLGPPGSARDIVRPPAEDLFR